jgi:uncharacterized protein
MRNFQWKRDMHYLLFYETAPDYLERRPQFRTRHLDYAWKAAERGELLLGGALADPVDGAVLLFDCDDPQPVENFARNDPYVLSGLVSGWKIRPWTTVVGEHAATPIR